MHPPPASGQSSGSSSLRRVQAFRATNLGLERRLTPSNVDAKEPRLLISYNVWWQWLDGLQHVADELKSGAATPMLLRLQHEESGASWDVPLKPRVKDGMQLEPSTLAVLLGALGARAGHHLVFELVASECSSAALVAKVRLVERTCGRPPVPHSAPVDLPGTALPRIMPPLQNAVCQQRYEEAVMSKGSGSEAVPEDESADAEAGAPHRKQRRYAQQAQAEAWLRCDNIIQELFSMTGGAVQQEFGHPVDPERFPAYRIIVKRPMDLGSIEARLPTAWSRPDAYDSPLQFRDDVRLVFDNCRLYSVPGTTLRKLGEAASAKFEKLWAAEEVVRFWQQGQQPEGAAAVPTAAGVQPAAQPPEQQTAAPAPTEQENAAPAATEQQGQQPPPAPQQQQQPQVSEPTPPPDAHSYHGQHWEHRSPYASSAPRGPTPVSFAKKTLQKLFGWQHGSDKNIRPTAVLRYVPSGSTQSVEVEAQLLPPGRDDAEVQARKEEGGPRPKVDGYRLPTEALRVLYQGLAAQEGARLRFTSAGWRGTQLVFDVSLLPADIADTTASMGGSLPAADPEPQVAANTGRAHDAAAAAAAAAQAPAAGATPTAAVAQAAVAAAAAGAQPEVAAAAGPTPEPAAAPAAAPAAPQGDALLDGLAAAAEAASSGHQPLAAIAGSFDVAAQTIIQRGREGWLSTESAYDLLVHGQEWGIELAMDAPVRPAAGDLFLVDGGRQLERRDGHSWLDRRSAKLRVKGREAVQVVYHTTADRSLQRRWYNLLDDPNSRAHLLHYQLPESELTGRRQRGPRRKGDSAVAGEPDSMPAKRFRQSVPGGESLQAVNAGAAADASAAHPLPAKECRQTARPHEHTVHDLQHDPRPALAPSLQAAQRQQYVEQGMAALETAGDDPAAWRAALGLLVQGGVGGETLQGAVAGWDALTPQQRCGVQVEVLRAAVQGSWAQLEGRLRGVLGLPPMPEGVAAAAVAPAGVPAQPAAALVAAFQAAQQRSQPTQPPKPTQPPHKGSLPPAPAIAAAAPNRGAADPATRAAQLADESSGTNRLAVFQALQRILRRAGVSGSDMQAFLKRHVMDNPDGEQRAMHWSILSEHDREREDDLIRAWVQQNL